MKKNIKLVLALVLSIMMVLGSMSALAASITLLQGDTHTYRVFQVLKGTLAKEGDKELGNPEWGADATDAAKATNVNDFITAITAPGLSEADIAAMVAGKVDTTGEGRGTVTAADALDSLATGYYVLVDETSLTGDHQLETKSLHVVQVLNDATPIRIKYDSTSDDKIIVSDTLGTATASNPHAVYSDADPKNDGKTNDVSVGDTVNFQIKAKVPATTADYDFFYFIINDTLSKGLTLNEDSIKVYHSAVDPAKLIAADTDSTQNENGYNTRIDTPAADGSVSFHIGLKNAKTYNDEYIFVTYSAVLNEDAVIGETGNPNTSTVKFSNNPNEDYDGTQDNDEPGFPADDKTPSLGETPVTTTETFSTQIKLRKVDSEGKPLVGAEFTLTGDSVQTVIVKKSEFVKSGDEGYDGTKSNTHYLLKDGTYTDADPVEDHYEETGIGTAETTEGYIKVNDEYKVPENKDDYVDQTLYKFVKGNADQYASEKIYQKIEAENQVLDSTSVTIKAYVDGEGYVSFVGLGAGEYTISETHTPSGYNTIADQKLEIVFTAKPADGDKHWSVGAKTTKVDNAYVFTYNTGTETFEANIVNNKGTQLPSTGGIGTTIFYAAGSILVLAAAILLITKRRMSAND